MWEIWSGHVTQAQGHAFCTLSELNILAKLYENPVYPESGLEHATDRQAFTLPYIIISLVVALSIKYITVDHFIFA